MSRVNELNVNAMWSIYWKQLFPHFFDLSLQPLVLLFLIHKIISEKPWVLYCIDTDLLSKCINCSNAVDFYKKMKYNSWLNIGNCRTLVILLRSYVLLLWVQKEVWRSILTKIKIPLLNDSDKFIVINNLILKTQNEIRSNKYDIF